MPLPTLLARPVRALAALAALLVLAGCEANTAPAAQVRTPGAGPTRQLRERGSRA